MVFLCEHVEACTEPSQISEMEVFWENSWRLSAVTVIENDSMLDLWLGSECAYGTILTEFLAFSYCL